MGRSWWLLGGSYGVGVAGPHGAFRHCWKAFCGCWQPPARLSAVGTLRIGKHSLEDWKALQRHGFLVHVSVQAYVMDSLLSKSINP